MKTIRSMSGFGFAMVFVIFKEDVDYYWARSRVIERMNVAQQRLAPGVVPVIGPDATALGQVFWYTVEGEGFDLAELRFDPGLVPALSTQRGRRRKRSRQHRRLCEAVPDRHASRISCALIASR